jgi:hypothetical protein
MASQAFIENIQQVMDNRLFVTGIFFDPTKPMICQIMIYY